MPTTARDVVTMALQAAGVTGFAQTPSSSDINRGFAALRRMLGAWQAKRYMVPVLRTFSKVATGATSYTVGSGGDFDTGIRPNRIASAYVVQNNTGSNPVSLPLSDLGSRENYNLIPVKSLVSLPSHYFLDNDFTPNMLANVFFWPIPSSAYTLYISVVGAFGFPTDLNSDYTLPPEYEEPLHYNLTKRICADYQLPLSQEINDLATSGFRAIRKANVQVPELLMPSALSSGGNFNIYSGR